MKATTFVGVILVGVAVGHVLTALNTEAAAAEAAAARATGVWNVLQNFIH